jgi:hypothetical protein
MFGKLFGTKPKSVHAEDQVWITTAARLRGMRGLIDQRLAEGRSVILVCLSNAAFDLWSDALALREPVRCRDLFGRDALRAALPRAGALIIALSGSLPAELNPVTVPLDVLVYGRNNARADDEAITRFADQLGTLASIAFHVSLEDELLAPYAGNLRPLLEQLGMNENEALSSAVLTRAIRNSQQR